MKVFVFPSKDLVPERGGVKEHLRQLYRQLEKHDNVELVSSMDNADVIHVESSWYCTNFPDVYVCHGGFVPHPINSVLKNLKNAKYIVTVADWISKKYFPEYSNKTIVIPNGIDLKDFEGLYPYTRPDPYIVYAKEWLYNIDDLVAISKAFDYIDFVTTIWPDNIDPPNNVDVIGLQDHVSMMSILKGATALLLTGSEVSPTMLLEAWALGVPVIAKNIDGSKEIMQFVDGSIHGGYLYDDLTDLYGYIHTVVHDFSEEGMEGKEIVYRDYQWKDLIEKYVDLYRLVSL